ncbi:MAG: FtsX-like permease family protein [Solirubrobacteraceae bacterium]
MATETLRARALLGPYALAWFYRRWLRVHAVQELLAGLGVAIAVALVFATVVAAGSIAGSAREVLHTVVGPASLQLHARSPEGMPESLLGRVQRLPGVREAAPLLEQSARLSGSGGRSVTVDLAGADVGLVVLDGLGHTIPRETLSAHGIGLSSTTAERLGLPRDAATHGGEVRLSLRGRSLRLPVSAVLGPEAFGPLSQATVAVMQLRELQRLAGLSNRISRVLVVPRPGRGSGVRAKLGRLAEGRVDVASANQDISLLRQALRPSNEASAFFATISGLLGLLLAGGGLLLTAPARRRMIAELRLMGTRRTAIVQMFLFQALLLGVLASAVGLAAGFALSLGLLQQSPRYLAEAFTLGAQSIVTSTALTIALACGIASTCIASALPLLDLSHRGTLDGVYREEGVPGNALGSGARRGFALAAAVLLVAATAMFLAVPSLALVACALLSLATVLTVPLALGAVMRAGRALAERREQLTVLPVALSSLRASTLRSLALASIGAVALFGSVALGGARGDLIGGIARFARAYSRDATIWVGSPHDDQAVVDFARSGLTRRIAALPGVAGVQEFTGSFIQFAGRRVWLIARPPGAMRTVLAAELRTGSVARTEALLASGDWIAVSQQIAEQEHAHLGGTLRLPTPSGNVPFRVAALSTNLAWSPGVVFLGSATYERLWRSRAPTALGVTLAPGASEPLLAARIAATLGPSRGLAVRSSAQLRTSIEALTSEGLRQLAEISTLLLLAAILAMGAALTSAIWQRRSALAGLRLSGVTPGRLRRILLVESMLMLGAGCMTGAVAGIYGEAVIDGYLRQVTGFPVVGMATGTRPPEIFALVIVVVLLIAAAPALAASRVSPRLAFNE